MKKIFTIFISFVALVTTYSCSNSFIDQVKPLSMTEDVVFSNPEYIEADLLGCYSIFKASNPTFMGGNGFVVADSRGDDIVNVSNPVTMQNTYEMKVLSTDEENSDIWNYAYYSINYSNLFADKLAKYNCKELLGEALYNQYIAEARFIRAYSYYVLCQLWSEPYCKNPNALAVPLRLTGLDASGNNACPESTISVIYNQILADCMPDALPNDVAGTRDGVTRATAAAAHLLKMRVYMAMEDWDKAITEGLAITGYELASDVTSLYGKDDVYSSKEMIFAMPSTLQDKPNTQQSCAEFCSPDAQVTWIDEESGIASIEGYFQDKDARVSELVSEPDSNGCKYSLKYLDYGGHLDWVPLMRYAEVKLNLAECYANKAGKLTEAKAALSEVRRRSIAKDDDIIDIESLTGSTIMTAVYNERRLEFLAEGMRGFDIMRRGENFVKANSYVTINVGYGDNGYVWPIPDSEKRFNNMLNK